MALIYPPYDLLGTTAPTGIWLSEHQFEKLGAAARFPLWISSAGNGWDWVGGGTDNTNPRVDATLGPHRRRVIRFAPSAPYQPLMQSVATANQLWGASAKCVTMALYVNSMTDVRGYGAGRLGEGILCANYFLLAAARYTLDGLPYLRACNYSGGWVEAMCGPIELQRWYAVMLLLYTSGDLYIYAWDQQGVALSTYIGSGATSSGADRPYLGYNPASGLYGDFAIGDLRTWAAVPLTAAPLQAGWGPLFAYYMSAWGYRGDAAPYALDVGSREMERSSKLSEGIECPELSNVAYFDMRPGDRFAIRDDRAAADASGIGVGEAAWRQREGIVSNIVFDGRGRIAISGRATRRRAPRYCLDFGRLSAASTRWENGVLRVQPPGMRTAYGRPGYAWVERPIDGLVDRVLPDSLCLAPWGLLACGCSRNHVLNSSCVGGSAASWAVSADGAHGGTVAPTATLGSGVDLFSQNVSTHAWKMVHGTGAGKTEQSIAQTITTLSVDHPLSIDWAITAPSLRISRASDGWYWNDATPGWQAASVDNLCAGTPNARGIARHQTKPITMAGPTNITIRVLQPASMADGAVTWVQHVQDEERYDPISGNVTGAAYATSRIVTTSAVGTRHADNMPLCVPASGLTYLPTDHMTFAICFRPLWSDTDPESVQIRVFHADYDAAAALNRNMISYKKPFGEWAFENGGAQATLAPAVASVTRNTWHVLVARTVGAAGEHGLEPYTKSIFVDGVKGTDSVGFAGPLQAPIVPVMFGPAAYNVNLFGCADSYIFRTEIYPEALSDDEVATLSADLIAQAEAETPEA